jgi:uncharacterized membrane protein YhdT
MQCSSVCCSGIGQSARSPLSTGYRDGSQMARGTRFVLILAATAFLLLWSIFAFGPGHPSNKQMLYEWWGFVMLGVPLILVATFYVLLPRPRA